MDEHDSELALTSVAAAKLLHEASAFVLDNVTSQFGIVRETVWRHPSGQPILKLWISRSDLVRLTNNWHGE